jgi:hypothetical protein
MEKLGTRSFIDWHYNGPPKEEDTLYKAKADKSQVPDEVDVDEETQSNSYLLL